MQIQGSVFIAQLSHLFLPPAQGIARLARERHMRPAARKPVEHLSGTRLTPLPSYRV
jgi:hypothetical protein